MKDICRSTENCHGYAKALLQQIYGVKFFGLECKDSPDLQDINNSIGIEVTKAVNPKMEKILSAFQQRKKLDKRFVVFNDNSLIQFINESIEEKIYQIKRSYLDKINKLNDGKYDGFKEVSLLIFVGLKGTIDLNLLLKIFETDKKKNFKFVYLVAYDNFYEFDLEYKTYKIINYVNNGVNYKEIASEKSRFFWF